MPTTSLDLGAKTNTNLSGTPTGSNLLPGSAPTTGSGVSWNSGTSTATAVSATDLIRWNGSLTSGAFYQVTFNYTMSSGSKIRITNGLSAGQQIVFTSAVLGASGSVTANFTATDVNLAFEADSAVFSGTISSIVVKLVPAMTVATSTGAGGARSNRAMQGLTYFEATPTTVTGTPSVGIANLNWNTSTALQSGINTLAYLATGAVQINGVTLATIATWAQGNRIDCAVHLLYRLIWFRVAGGNWNNNALNDPATLVGGIDFSSMGALGTMAAAVYASATGNVWTLAFSSFAGTAPTGFQSLDTIQYVVANNLDVNYEALPPAGMQFSPIARAMPSPLDRYQRAFSPAGAMTVVSGTTKEAGTLVAGKKVEIYDRITGELLGNTLSDGSGNWSIACLGRPAVRVVGSDPTTYNSVVYDNVVPV